MNNSNNGRPPRPKVVVEESSPLLETPPEDDDDEEEEEGVDSPRGVGGVHRRHHVEPRILYNPMSCSEAVIAAATEAARREARYAHS